MAKLLLMFIALGTLQAQIPIKVVVVTMFERGEDTGDQPGEFQLWVEREHLDPLLSKTILTRKGASGREIALLQLIKQNRFVYEAC